MIWAAGTLATILAGAVWLAVWLAPVAALAAISSLRSWPAKTAAEQDAPRNGARPPIVLAGASAAAVTLTATAGPLAALVAGALVAGAFGLVIPVPARHGPGRIRLVAIVLAPAAASVSLVLTRRQGLPECLVLAGMVTLYDSATFLIGTGARNRFEGPVAGLASIAALTLLVAAVLVPPFRGASPWILGLLAAVLAPVGPKMVAHLTGDARARVPALRRLDSLLLLGPAWFIGTSVLIHR